MVEEAYEKCEKTQGNGIWAEERGTPVERSQGHTAAALLKNRPQVHPSAQRQCGRPDGSRDLESHFIPSTGGHCRRGTDPFWDRSEHESKAASRQIGRNRKATWGGKWMWRGAVFSAPVKRWQKTAPLGAVFGTLSTTPQPAVWLL
jgi:hypothetical protein